MQAVNKKKKKRDNENNYKNINIYPFLGRGKMEPSSGVDLPSGLQLPAGTARFGFFSVF